MKVHAVAPKGSRLGSPTLLGAGGPSLLNCFRCGLWRRKTFPAEPADTPQSLCAQPPALTCSWTSPTVWRPLRGQSAPVSP